VTLQQTYTVVKTQKFKLTCNNCWFIMAHNKLYMYIAVHNTA